MPELTLEQKAQQLQEKMEAAETKAENAKKKAEEIENELKTAKAEIEKTFVPKEYRDNGCTWNLNFTTNQLEIKAA